MQKYRSYGPASSIYDRFNIWPLSVTLTFSLPEQISQLALLLLRENTSAKLFRNKTHRGYSPDKLNFYHMTFNCDFDNQPT